MKRRIMALVLSIMMLVTTFPVSAEEYVSDDVSLVATDTDIGTEEPEITEAPEEPEASEEPEETPEPELLEIALAAAVRSAFAGESVQVTLNAQGGAGELAVTYTVTADGEQVVETERKTVTDGTDVFAFVPETSGEYAIHAVVTDEAERVAEATVTLPVAEHDETSMAQWTNRAKAVELTGDWREDIVAVAKTQLGYEESATDFVILEDGRHHYSIYGAKYGAAYADWNAAFVAYVAELAEIPGRGVTRTADVAKMLSGVKGQGAFENGKDYEPAAGDLVFFKDEDGRVVRVAIVEGASESGIQTIEGGEGAVARRSYSLHDETILGYGSMRTLMLKAGVLEVEALEVTSSLAVKSAFVGDEVSLNLTVMGGEGDLSATYEVTVDGEAQEEAAEAVELGENTYAFVPMMLGEYTIHAVITDEAEQVAETEVVLPVAEHDETSLIEWTAKAEAATLTGDWRQDVVSVAQTQVGYAESETDFIVLEDESRHNYSVYGDWYGANYEEWNAEFVSFVLSYAGVPTSAVAQSKSAEAIRASVQDAVKEDDYAPVAGDLAFLSDGRMGIVTTANESGVQVIAGNVDGTVAVASYDLDNVTDIASMYDIMAIANELTTKEDAVAQIKREGNPMADGEGYVYYATLQDAIDSVADGETVEMLADVTENIVSGAKNYTLEMNNWKIDGAQKGSVYRIEGTTATTGKRVTIQNGTLTNGLANGKETSWVKDLSGMGGGLYVTGAAVTLDGMTITGNTATHGGGIALAGNANTSAIIKDTVISNNEATFAGLPYTSMVGGGGLYTQSSHTQYSDSSYYAGGNTTSVSMTDVQFLNNTSATVGSAMTALAESMTATGCTFSGNHGGAAETIFIGCEVGEVTRRTINFNNCHITGNTSGSYTVNMNIISMREDDTYGLTVNFNGGTISGNKAGVAGGVYKGCGVLNITNLVIEKNTATGNSEASAGAIVAPNGLWYPGSLTVKDTVIKGNHADGPGAGGVYIEPNSGVNATFTGGAIYNNTSAGGSANDVYARPYASASFIVTLPEAESMVDGDQSFEGYYWLNSTSDGTGSVDAATIKAASNVRYYLTAYQQVDGEVAEYAGETYSSIQDAVDAAKEDSASPAEIKLIAGEGEEDEASKIFTSLTTLVDLPVELDLNGRSITPGIATSPKGVLFVVNGDGSLKLTGEGRLAGGIKVSNSNALTLDSKTGGLSVYLDSEVKNGDGYVPRILIGENFALAGSETVDVYLPTATLSKLNALNEDIEDIIIPVIAMAEGNVGELDMSQFAFPELEDNLLITIQVNEETGWIEIINPAAKLDGIFISQKGSNSTSYNGGYSRPYRSFSYALDALKKHNEENPDDPWNTIYIIDEVGQVITTDFSYNKGTWASTADFPVTIKRFSTSRVVSGEPLITIQYYALTLGEYVTIDGGGDRYTNCGPLVKVVSGGSLTIEGATLQNNNRAPQEGINATLTNEIMPYMGGAIYCEGTLTMTSGKITGCSALVGGGVLLYGSSATFDLSGGQITGNHADAFTYSGATKGVDGSGGGVGVYGNAKMTMTDGIIQDNSARNGGGIALGTGNWTNGESSRSVYGLTMNGGTIDGNTSLLEGGGVFVQGGYKAKFTKGYITNNRSNGGNYGGGAIYVNYGRTKAQDGRIELTNVLITDNTAGETGGGIAGCGTSTTHVLITNGSMIYGNHSGSYGKDDIAIGTGAEALQGWGSPEDDLPEFMLDGTPYRWIRCSSGTESTNERLKGQLVVQATKVLYTNATPLSEDPENLASVIIKGNSAAIRGGGIGSNSEVEIGGSDETIAFTVSKSWVDENNNDLGTPDTFAPEYQEVMDEFEQINIWVLIYVDGVARIVTHNELRDYYGNWLASTTFTGLKAPASGEAYILLEEAVMTDGTHVWSQVSESAHAAAVRACIEEEMSRRGLPMIWSDDLESPYETSDISGIVVSAGITASLTNRLTIPVTGSLSISKTVTVDRAPEGKSFTFTVILAEDAAYNNPLRREYACTIITEDGDEYEPATIVSGDAIELEHNQTAVITGLPIGTYYKVTETVDDAYVMTFEGRTEGQITQDKADVQVAFINELKTGNLEVTKTVTGPGDNADAEFEFTVTLNEKIADGTYGEMKFVGGEATFKLKAGEKKTATELPAGIEYTVTEAAADHYAVVMPKNGKTTGKVKADETATAAFTNERKTGDLEVTKMVTGPGDHTDATFEFTVTLNEKIADGTYGEMKFVGGVATFTLKAGEKKTATGLPAGTEYTVTEKSADLYTVVTPENGKTSGTIKAGETATAAFTNKRLTGGLKVTKTVTGTAGDTEKAFTFTVTLSDATVNGSFGGMTFEKGVASFTLKHGESATATGLPAGIKYTVTESDNEGYTVTVTGSATGGIEANKTATVAFENNKDATPPVSTDKPSPVPTDKPSSAPTDNPSSVPTDMPSPVPTDSPASTDTPTATPTAEPTAEPTATATATPAQTTNVTPVPTAGPEEYIDIAGQKFWNDNDDEMGLRPESVVVKLLRNGVKVAEQTVTAENGWSYRFEHQPVWNEYGSAYVYTVDEQLVNGYYCRANGYDLINTLLPVTDSDRPGLDVPPGFEQLRLTVEELTNLLNVFDYDIPLVGDLLGTGLEIPAYPFIFAGIGCLALVTLLMAGRKKRKNHR